MDGAPAERSHPRELLLLLAAPLFLLGLNAPLMEPQEPRHAEIAREMLVEGDWLTPHLDEQPYLDKPPLLYWLTAFSFHIFGVHDWAARLVPSLAGLLTVLATWLWGRATAGPACALWGALILCLSARFVYLARLLTFDGLLCLWVTAALAAGHLALTEGRPRWSWWLLSAGACGLGLLTKGPVALALVLPPLLLAGFLDERYSRPTMGLAAGYLAAVGMVAAPWYGLVIWQHPDFAGYFFWTHNVVRYLAPFDHAEPIWFHWPGLLFGSLPWSLLLPGLLLSLVRSPRTGVKQSGARRCSCWPGPGACCSSRSRDASEPATSCRCSHRWPSPWDATSLRGVEPGCGPATWLCEPAR